MLSDRCDPIGISAKEATTCPGGTIWLARPCGAMIRGSKNGSNVHHSSASLGVPERQPSRRSVVALQVLQDQALRTLGSVTEKRETGRSKARRATFMADPGCKKDVKRIACLGGIRRVVVCTDLAKVLGDTLIPASNRAYTQSLAPEVLGFLARGSSGWALRRSSRQALLRRNWIRVQSGPSRISTLLKTGRDLVPAIAGTDGLLAPLPSQRTREKRTNLHVDCQLPHLPLTSEFARSTQTQKRQMLTHSSPTA